jgi:hypothetical protein
METLLYVSSSRIDPAVAEETVAAIVAASIPRNTARGLTGSIIFTGTHFAQILEGAPEMIDRLLPSLEADDRHGDIIIVARSPLPARRFAQWSMAYSGPSQFIGRQINRVVNDPSPPELRRAAGWLTDVMQEFAAR